MENSENLE